MAVSKSSRSVRKVKNYKVFFVGQSGNATSTMCLLAAVIHGGIQASHRHLETETQSSMMVTFLTNDSESSRKILLTARRYTHISKAEKMIQYFRSFLVNV